MGYGDDPSAWVGTACLCGLLARTRRQARTQTGFWAVDVFAVSEDGG